MSSAGKTVTHTLNPRYLVSVIGCFRRQYLFEGHFEFEVRVWCQLMRLVGVECGAEQVQEILNTSIVDVNSRISRQQWCNGSERTQFNEIVCNSMAVARNALIDW